MQAMKAGDRAEALSLARRAYEERPNTPWAVATLLDLQLEAGDWKHAQPLLQHAAKMQGAGRSGCAPAPRGDRRRTRPARTAADTGLDAAREAVKLAPDLVPARAMLARLSAQAGRPKDARRTIEQGWVDQPPSRTGGSLCGDRAAGRAAGALPALRAPE